MNDLLTLQALCTLLMRDDPTGLAPDARARIENWTDKKSRDFGFDNWIDAYHWTGDSERKTAESMKAGIILIAEERARQINTEGWTPEHDDEHQLNEMTAAASCYLTAAAIADQGGCGYDDCPNYWPWEAEWWKPSEDPIRNLVKAGALIAAEIDRLSRQNNQDQKPCPPKS